MKKYLFGIIAICMGLIFSAFTLQKNKIPGITTENFTYNDYPNDTWKNNAMHYTLISGPLNCLGTAHRCAVVANDDGTGHPILSGATILNRN